MLFALMLALLLLLLVVLFDDGLTHVGGVVYVVEVRYGVRFWCCCCGWFLLFGFFYVVPALGIESVGVAVGVATVVFDNALLRCLLLLIWLLLLVLMLFVYVLRC